MPLTHNGEFPYIRGHLKQALITCFGVKPIGTLVGLVGVAWSAGGITGPLFAAYLFDFTKSYELFFLVGGLLLTVGSASVYFFEERGKVRPPDHNPGRIKDPGMNQSD